MPYKDPQKRRDHRRAYYRIYYRAHQEAEKTRRRAYYQTNREKSNMQSRMYRQTHLEETKAYSRMYHQTVFAEALRVLGDKCACPGCGVSEPLFLTIDHINAQPKQRRNAIDEAKASGWDKTKFQIICYNCNCAKRDRGFCPVHQASAETNGHRPGVSTEQTSL